MILSKHNLNRESDSSTKPWWNRPLIGQRSVVQRVADALRKKPVPEEMIKLYHASLAQLQSLTHRIHSIDNEKFGNEEFLAFAKIKFLLLKGEWGYPGFEQSIDLLKAGIQAHKSFLGLEKVEFNHQGSRLGEMYEFVSSLCSQKVRNEVFLRQVKGKFSEILPQVKTQEGRQALQLYLKHLENVAKHRLSLHLLYAFREYKMKNYAIFKDVSEIIGELKRGDLLNLEKLTSKVILNFEVFESLGQVIGIPDKERTPKTYAKVLQYAALMDKHQSAFLQFSQMVDLLQDWKKIFDQNMTLQQEYSPIKYKLPREFKRPMPGFNIYQKYSSYFD